MAIKNSTLQLKARVTGSSWAKAVPHMAQPCASASGAATAPAETRATSNGNTRRTAICMLESVEIDKREQEDPEPADEVPVDGAHLQAGRGAPSHAGMPRQQRERGEPHDRHEHVHRVAADQQ